MARKPYDPLAVIPSPEAIRERLTQTLTLAERLRKTAAWKAFCDRRDAIVAIIEDQAEDSPRHGRRHKPS